MRKYLLSLYFVFASLVCFSQEIHLSDSVIYFNNKAVAYYVKQLSESAPHYNIYIISLEKKLLIAARIIKFDAPVPELEPFYYYDLIFQNEKDTIAIYHEGQAFSIELASILKEYNLLDGNKINTHSLADFKKKDNGSVALLAKIKEYQDYLNYSRFFNEQVVRDRTKPVIIVNENIIMQDGKKIGLITTGSRFRETDSGGLPDNNGIEPSKDGMWTPYNAGDIGTTTYKIIDYLLPTNRIVRPQKAIESLKDEKTQKNIKALYETSIPFNKKLLNADFLYNACVLIENYLL